MLHSIKCILFAVIVRSHNLPFQKSIHHVTKPLQFIFSDVQGVVKLLLVIIQDIICDF
jgi:hypothetical protein